MSAARKKLDWEAMFGLAIDPEEGAGIPSVLQAGEGGYLLHVRQFLCRAQYEPDFGWGNCLYI